MCVHVYVCTLGRTGVRLMVEFQETERDFIRFKAQTGGQEAESLTEEVGQSELRQQILCAFRCVCVHACKLACGRVD